MATSELAAWIVLGAPALRLLARRPVRLEMKTHPLLTAGAAVGITVLIVFTHRLLQNSELAGAVFLAAALVSLLFIHLLASPAWGSRRGWPPGSLGLHASLDALEDPDFYRDAAARWGPVFKMRQFARPVVCITDLPRGHVLFSTHADDLRQSNWGPNSLVPGGYVEFMDGDAHARMQALLAPCLSAGATTALSAKRREHVRTSLQLMAGDCHRDDRVDPTPALRRLTFACVAEQTLGVARDSPRFAELFEAVTVLADPLDVVIPPPARARGAFAIVSRHVRDLLDDAENSNPQSHFGQLPSAARNDPALIGNLVLLTSNGFEILHRLLSWTMVRLAEQSEWINATRATADGSPGCADAAAASFVHEVLRLHGSPYVYRQTIRACRVDKFVIPSGWLVRLCVREAHLSTGSFVEPERFDPRRWGTSAHSHNSYLPFGPSGHSCLGDHLTMATAVALVVECITSWDLDIAVNAPPERGNRHWYVPRPHSSLRLRITRAAGRFATGV